MDLLPPCARTALPKHDEPMSHGSFVGLKLSLRKGEEGAPL